MIRPHLFHLVLINAVCLAALAAAACAATPAVNGDRIAVAVAATESGSTTPAGSITAPGTTNTAPSGTLAQAVAAATTNALDSPAGSSPAVRVVITRDFGQTILKDLRVEIDSGLDAMQALQQAAQVETSYGGGFVDSIDGLRSGYSGNRKDKQDWFYSVNGLIANTGALDYPLSDGYIEQWDFHSWQFRQMIPAQIGHFPQPFSGGSRGSVYPTLVVYSPGLEDQAQKIRQSLIDQRVPDPVVRAEAVLTEAEKAGSNLIILGLPSSPLVQELNTGWKRLGFFARFEDSRLLALDASGAVQAEYSAGAGVLQATQNPWNPNGTGAGETLVWMVSGCDESGLSQAVESLLKGAASWQFGYGAVILPEAVIKLPCA